MKKLTHAQTRQAILTAWKAGLVPNLIGPVGIGKTAIVKQLAAEIAKDKPGFKLWQFLTSTVQSVDIGGYPVPPAGDKKTVQYAPPSYLPYILGDETDGECGILFCDEVDRSTIETLNALTQLFHGGQIHEFRLRKGVLIVTAMNGESDTGTTVLPEAIKTRLVNIYVDDVIKPDWYKSQGWDIADMIPLLNYDCKDMTERMGSLNNRTLEFALKFMDAADKLATSPDWEDDEEVRMACLTGLVGDHNAETIMIARSIPTIEEIVKNPSGAKVPSQIAQRQAVSKRVVEFFNSTRSAEKKTGIVTYATRLGNELLAATSGGGSLMKAVEDRKNMQPTKG